MFETAVLSSGPQTKRMWTTCLGFSGQALLLSALVISPMISPRVLPRVVWAVTLAPPSPPPAPPPPGDPRVVPVNQVRATRIFHGITEPAAVPRIIERVIDPADAPPPGAYVPGAIAGSREGVPGGIADAVAGLAARFVPVVRPPEPVVREAPRPQPPPPPRITQVRMAEPIQRVTPIYPPLARVAHVSGKVELSGVLGVDGRIHEVRVVSGHPLLVKAAVDAVMQWIYRPTTLNGVAVEVEAPIIVNFILN